MIPAVIIAFLVAAGFGAFRAVAFVTARQVTAAEVTPSAHGFLVPSSAVVREGDQSVVYVYANGHIVRQPVVVDSTVPATPDLTTVAQGLSSHAKVVTSPTGLRDGEDARLQ